VARRADPVRVAVIHGEPRVIESGSQPTRGRVASGAACRESRRYVIRIIRGLIFRLVTAEAVGRNCSVVVVHVTVCTCHGRVLPGQWETRVAVVEGRRAPGRRAVAHVALLRKADRRVVWVVRVLKILQMAAYAGRVCNVVVRIDVTLAALQSRVSPRQRPSGRCVVERCRVPVRGRMADLALLREAGRRVVWVVRVLKIL
jgi:hypothetical protein